MSAQIHTWARALGSRAYLILALLFSAAILSGVTDSYERTAESRLFDTLVSHRVAPPEPSSNIVILDIDEASLASMAKQFGRWPWPNAVMGEMAMALEQEGARAVVFDILFSDWDTLRPESDKAFDAAIARTNRTYFPFLRLNPDNDHLSKIPIGALPMVTAQRPDADANAPVAIVLPKAPSALDSGRLGTTQVEPERDSVIRRYPLWLEHAGYRMPSLPEKLANDLHWPAWNREHSQFLINWYGPAFTYPYVSFEQAYKELVTRTTSQSSAFKDRIVVIGSTAPSLFDVKASPVARIHPGVEILATAIDNLQQGSSLRERPRWIMLAAALCLVWTFAVALYAEVRIETIDFGFAALQIGLITGAFLILNCTHWYIDVSGPLTLSAAYFGAARIYFSQSHKWLAQGKADLKRVTDEPSQHVVVLAVRWHRSTPSEIRLLKSTIDRLIGHPGCSAGRVSRIIEDAGLPQRSLADTMTIYWKACPDTTLALDMRHQIAAALADKNAKLRFAVESHACNPLDESATKQAMRTTLLQALLTISKEEDSDVEIN